MNKKKFENLLSRRILGDSGWMFFCRLCGKYQPQENFYKKTNSKWGLDSKCKLHYERKDEDDDPEMAYLKLDTILEKDFKNTQEFLIALGYTFQSHMTIHEQFCIKHKLKFNKN